ncbi:MAG: hypothetical protein ACI36W_06165 [Coriobacteriales bacterium]
MRAYDITHSVQDLRYLCWDESSQPSGLGGPKLKAREGTGANAVYYKLSSFSEKSGVYGWELANQLVCTRLAQELGFPASDCRLLRALVRIGDAEIETWVLRSKSYRRTGETSLSLQEFCELAGLPGEGPLELCLRMGWGEQVAQVIVLDYLTANRGRDTSSFEVLRSAGGRYRLSPLTGGSFSLGSAFPRQLWRLDPLADLPTCNYLGSTSLRENLSLLPAGFAPKPLSTASKRTLLKGLDAVAPKAADFQEGSWHIIWRRWQEYARLCRL